MLRQITRVSKFWREYAGTLAVEDIDDETPMASIVALMIAAVSSSQTKPDESKSLWPSLTSKK
jgi:hypothetical protein